MEPIGDIAELHKVPWRRFPQKPLEGASNAADRVTLGLGLRCKVGVDTKASYAKGSVGNPFVVV